VFTSVSTPVPTLNGPVAVDSSARRFARTTSPNVDVVAALLPVAVHGHGLAGEHPLAEDRDHARLAVRVLAGAVDVRVASATNGMWYSAW